MTAALVILFVFSAGCLGGLVNAVLVGELQLPKRDAQAGVYRPGWVGNVLVGGVRSGQASVEQDGSRDRKDQRRARVFAEGTHQGVNVMADQDSRDAIAPAPAGAPAVQPTSAGAVTPAAPSGAISEQRKRMRALLDQLERASPFESSSLARQVREQAAVLATLQRAG